MTDPIEENEPDLLALWHFSIAAGQDADDVDDGKLAGFYIDATQVAQAIARLRHAPGFREWPDGFRAYGQSLDELYWPDGFGDWDNPPAYGPPPPMWRLVRGAVVPGMALYRAVHCRGGDGPDTKGLEVYSSLAHAAAAIAWLREKPGFCDWPEGFRIEEYRLDEDAVPEGSTPDAVP